MSGPLNAAHLRGMTLPFQPAIDPFAADPFTGSPLPAEVGFQMAMIASATCPTCQRLSARIETRSTAIPGGINFSQAFVCANEHSWPYIEVTAGENDGEDPDDE